MINSRETARNIYQASVKTRGNIDLYQDHAIIFRPGDMGLCMMIFLCLRPKVGYVTFLEGRCFILVAHSEF